MGADKRSRRGLLRATGVCVGVALAGCSRGWGGGPPEDIDPELYPPGTDESGVVDPEALFDAHLEGLSDVSYAYEQTFDPGPGESQRIEGRQQGSVQGPRFLRFRVRRTDEGDDPHYRMEYTRTIDAWHGPGMAVDLEYRRVHEAVEVTNVEAYEERSRWAEEYPPGERTEYDRRRFNVLAHYQRDYVRNYALLPLSFRPTGSVTGDGTTQVRFAVDGFSESQPFPNRTEPSGDLLVRSDGIIERFDLTLRERGGDGVAGASTTISELGSATVRDEPAWVQREFDGEPSRSGYDRSAGRSLRE